MKIKEEIIAMLMSWFIGFILFSAFNNISIVDDKQDIFLNDRTYYKVEISWIQSKLDFLINQCK